MRWITGLLSWGYANVLGNLVASALTFTAALAWHHRRVKALVRELHQRFDDLTHDQPAGDESGGEP